MQLMALYALRHEQIRATMLPPDICRAADAAHADAAADYFADTDAPAITPDFALTPLASLPLRARCAR